MHAHGHTQARAGGVAVCKASWESLAVRPPTPFAGSIRVDCQGGGRLRRARALHSRRACPPARSASAFAPAGLAVLVAPRVSFRLAESLRQPSYLAAAFAAAAPLRSAPPGPSVASVSVSACSIVLACRLLLAPRCGGLSLPLRLLGVFLPWQDGSTTVSRGSSRCVPCSRRKGHGLTPVHGLCPYPP